jgi:hypothetical protein
VSGLPLRTVTAVAVTWLLLVVVPVWWLDDVGYEKWLGALLAFGVVVAVVAGVGVLASGTRDRGVDRVLALHAELTPGLEADDAALLRFCERAWLAQRSGALDDPTAARLIGRPAVRWDRALAHDDQDGRWALTALAAWAEAYARDHAWRHPHLELESPQTEP